MNIPSRFKARPPISLILLPTYSLMTKRVNQSVKALEVWPYEATVAIHDCFDYTDWHVSRYATTWENHIIRHITHVSQRQGLSPNQKALMNGEVRALSRAKKLPFGHVTRKHSTSPELD